MKRWSPWCDGYHGCGSCDGPCEAEENMSEDFKIVDVYLKGSRPQLPLVTGPVVVDAQAVRDTFNKMFDHAFQTGLYYGKNWDKREKLDNGSVTINNVVVEPPIVYDILDGLIIAKGGTS
jgi:hypothetical protein